jgi:hypothetical protein
MSFSAGVMVFASTGYQADHASGLGDDVRQACLLSSWVKPLEYPEIYISNRALRFIFDGRTDQASVY